MRVVDAVPTGLVVLAGLDPSCVTLSERYEAFVEEYVSVNLDV